MTFGAPRCLPGLVAAPRCLPGLVAAPRHHLSLASFTRHRRSHLSDTADPRRPSRLPHRQRRSGVVATRKWEDETFECIRR
jgi:hypothetical protein